MINLIIGTEIEAQDKSIELISSKTCFSVADARSLKKPKEFDKRDVLLIKNLDNKLLFEEIVSVLDDLMQDGVETIAITYRDDIIEAYEEADGVNIIDLRGE